MPIQRPKPVTLPLRTRTTAKMRARTQPKCGAAAKTTRVCYGCEMNKYGGYEEVRGFVDDGGCEVCPYDDVPLAEQNQAKINEVRNKLHDQLLYLKRIVDDPHYARHPHLEPLRVAVSNLQASLHHINTLMADCGPSELVRTMAEAVRMNGYNDLVPSDILARRSSY